MSQQDRSLRLVLADVSWNIQYLRLIRGWLLEGLSFSGTRLRSDCAWTPRALAVAGIVWAWADAKTLSQRFSAATKVTAKIMADMGLRERSYQAFVKLLVRHTPTLIPPIVDHLRRRMQEDLQKQFSIDGRNVFAVDGTKILLPKTRSNEKAYAKTRKRKQKRTDVGATTRSGHLKNKVPQFYVTVLWNLGTTLLWDWRAGPSNASETEHLEEMLESLPERSLLVADAGFIGYDLWSHILDAGHDMVVRVGANVKLLKKLGFTRESASTAYYWPNDKREAGELPLVFRLVEVTGGKHPMYLLTNLRQRELSDSKLAELYRRRWGVEIYYRTFKCTFGRHKLRSGNAANAMCELTWSLVGLWAAATFALCATEIEPTRLSMAGVIRSIQTTITHYRVRPEPDEDLLSNLQLCEIDPYVRKSKASRNPTILTRNYQASRRPKIVNASECQLRKAKTLKMELRLTA